MKKQNRGITLIALIITIIVLLILAGVSIATLTGDNGILTQAQKAKEQTKTAEEKEQISLALMQMKIDDEKNAEMFQQYLQKNTGDGNIKVYPEGEKYIVHFLESNNVYDVDENGNINIVKEDAVAGHFEGKGSKEDPFIIMSIEDLVYLANQVNSMKNNYDGKWVALGKTLDFKLELSYKDAEAKYSYDETTDSYIPDENSKTTLMELCTTGEGFIPINGFIGSLNGNGYYISNLYEKRNGVAGLFASTGGSSKIENLTISGQVTSNDNYAAGFVGLPQVVTIENCTNNVEVYGNRAGGFSGYYHQGSELVFKNCINNGKITGEDSAAGILGYAGGGGSFSNCVNNGEIKGKYAGGIAGTAYYANWNQSGGDNIQNVYFAGTIQGGTNVGGIIGRNNCADFEKLSVTNCYYINTVEKGISNDEKDGIKALSEEDMKEKDTLVTYLRSYTNAEQELSVWNKSSNEYPIHAY